MMLCYSKTRKIKYFFEPPPQKRVMDTNGRDNTHKCLTIPAAGDLDIH